MSDDPMPSTESNVHNEEIQHLLEVNRRPLVGRLFGYFKLSGPGFIQSATTLGAGTATSSFYLGWKFGYSMIWVQILGMLMGVIMFAAVARPALCRDESIYRAMYKHVHPWIAILWALATIVASMIWCVSQYAAAVACLGDAGQVVGVISDEAPVGDNIKWIIGAAILIISIPLTWTYGSEKGRSVRLFEWILKLTIMFMVFCFAVVAWKTGINWGALGKGLIPNVSAIPELESKDLAKVLGALGCSVGINMTFLFPLSLKARGWGKEHLGFARFDLFGGMLVPFAVISTLVVVASANSLGDSATGPTGPTEVAARMFGGEGLGVSDTVGRLLFDLGIAAMPLSTITILMLMSGMAICEMMGVPHKGKWFKIGSLLPVVGILGTVHSAPFWLGPLISSFALILLPIAYFGFMILHNSRSYLGADAPQGTRRAVWTVVMGIILVIVLIGAFLKIKDSSTGLYDKLFPDDPPAATQE